jgi:hypothetical protein
MPTRTPRERSRGRRPGPRAAAVADVPVLQAPVKRASGGAIASSSARVVVDVEVDDDRPCVEAAERFEQHVDALEEELSEVDDHRVVGRQEVSRRSRLASSDPRSFALPGFGGSRPAASRSAARASLRECGRNSSNVDAGRDLVVDVAHELFQDAAVMPRSASASRIVSRPRDRVPRSHAWSTRDPTHAP